MQQSQPEVLAREPAAHGSRRVAGQRSATPPPALRPPPPPLAEAAPPVDATLLRCLQRAVEERAVAYDVQQVRQGSADARLLQRKVTVKGKLYKKNEKLPVIPPTMAARYQQRVLDAVTALVEGWRDDAVTTADRTFTNPSRFYQTAIDQIITGGAVGTPSAADPWARLAHAVGRDDGLVEMPWSSFDGGADALEAELKACNVQISSNTETTACHGNTHGKLPKKVIVPGGGPLDAVEIKRQPLYTPYYEFLIPGHKSDIEIERGVLDRNSRQIYITAHYETGSFVWLSGAPKSLLDNWVAKASRYRQQLMNPT